MILHNARNKSKVEKIHIKVISYLLYKVHYNGFKMNYNAFRFGPIFVPIFSPILVSESNMGIDYINKIIDDENPL